MLGDDDAKVGRGREPATDIGLRFYHNRHSSSSATFCPHSRSIIYKLSSTNGEGKIRHWTPIPLFLYDIGGIFESFGGGELLVLSGK